MNLIVQGLNKVLKFLLLGSILSLIFAGCKETKVDVITPEIEVSKETITINPINDTRNRINGRLFLEDGVFQKDLKNGFQELEYPEDVVGVIVPHHTVAHEYINATYQQISKNNNYDVIVVISPNHSSIGPRFQINLKDYSTLLGPVFIEQTLSQELIDSDLFYLAVDEAIDIEHGQAVQMTYIKHYFDDTPVISLIVSETRKFDGINAIGDRLSQVLEGLKVLYIGSIDFSHYLTLDEANKNDEYTRKILENNDYMAMMPLSNDYIDSPSTYGILMYQLTKGESLSTEVLYHSNAALCMGIPGLKETTSYFCVVYQEK